MALWIFSDRCRHRARALQVIEEARRKAAMLEKQTGEDGSKMAQRCGCTLW